MANRELSLEISILYDAVWCSLSSEEDIIDNDTQWFIRTLDGQFVFPFYHFNKTAKDLFLSARRSNGAKFIRIPKDLSTGRLDVILVQTSILKSKYEAVVLGRVHVGWKLGFVKGDGVSEGQNK